MDSSLNTTPSPAPHDSLAPDTTTGPNKDDSSGTFPAKPLGHQGGIKTGGNSIFETVLWCNGFDLTYNFGKIFNIFKSLWSY